MPTMRENLDVAIIGGGIGGLCLAIGIVKHCPNVTLTIYEAAHHFGEIGAGVAFGPNATRAMSLIDPAVKQGFDNCSTSNLWESKKDVWFDFRYGQDTPAEKRTGEAFHTLRCPAGQATVHRASFLDELIKLVPEGIAHFGKRVSSLEEQGEMIHLQFKDGSEATHQVVVGCDGIHSKVREYILGADDPSANAVYVGSYCHRGLAPMDKAVEAIGEELAMNNQAYLGKGGQLLTFPIARGKTFNAIAFKESDSWNDSKTVVPSTSDELHADYDSSWGETAQKIISLMDDTDIWALFNHLHAKSYYKWRVAMLGDAAHASSPHQGSGAGMAIEDAYVLSNILARVNRLEDVEKAFKGYDAVRRPRTQKQADTAREASHIWALDHPNYMDDFEKISKEVDQRMLWIWNEDLPAELDRAVAIMDGREQ